MRRGIYLGPTVHRAERIVRTVLIGLGALLVLHAGLYLWERSELTSAQSRLESGSASALRAATEAWSSEQRDSLWLARAIVSTGAPAAGAPTRLMRLVEEVLPDDVVLVSLTLEPFGTPPSIILEAVAPSDLDVSELERRIARTEAVTRNRMLEERRAPDGTVSIRVQLEYAR